ncbi:MAG TPA: hypothetical protein DCS93_16220 [Microscillaceae bacterium]|nr:hypothetical protein [Microscillaceae bacterium]
MDDTIRIVQFTDPFLLTNAYSQNTDPLVILEALLKHISQLGKKPDMLIITSEIARQRRSETLHLLQKTGIPFQWVAHEKTIALNVKEIHFVMLNSYTPELTSGLLSDDALSFLENDLEESWAHPCVVTLRHHPLAIRTLTSPRDLLKNASHFLKIIDSYYHVKAVLFGHIAHEFMVERNNIWFMASPSISPTNPQNNDIIFQYRVIDLTQEGEIETSLQRIVTPLFSHTKSSK